jgi:hypothetical protein
MFFLPIIEYVNLLGLFILFADKQPFTFMFLLSSAYLFFYITFINEKHFEVIFVVIIFVI